MKFIAQNFNSTLSISLISQYTINSVHFVYSLLETKKLTKSVIMIYKFCLIVNLIKRQQISNGLTLLLIIGTYYREVRKHFGVMTGQQNLLSFSFRC